MSNIYALATYISGLTSEMKSVALNLYVLKMICQEFYSLGPKRRPCEHLPSQKENEKETFCKIVLSKRNFGKNVSSSYALEKVI
jgi:hypothetical protein